MSETSMIETGLSGTLIARSRAWVADLVAARLTGTDAIATREGRGERAVRMIRNAPSASGPAEQWIKQRPSHRRSDQSIDRPT